MAIQGMNLPVVGCSARVKRLAVSSVTPSTSGPTSSIRRELVGRRVDVGLEVQPHPDSGPLLLQVCGGILLLRELLADRHPEHELRARRHRDDLSVRICEGDVLGGDDAAAVLPLSGHTAVLQTENWNAREKDRMV